jgi:hypothetical protein
MLKHIYIYNTYARIHIEDQHILTNCEEIYKYRDHLYNNNNRNGKTRIS